MVNGCDLCRDAATIARVVSIRDGLATVKSDGCRAKVALELVPEARVGDFVLCHAGVALQVVEDE